MFDQFLINEALDVIEAAGGSFHLLKCEVGQTSSCMSYSELEVSWTTDTMFLLVNQSVHSSHSTFVCCHTCIILELSVVLSMLILSASSRGISFLSLR